jgi:hypothetical protein
MRELALHLLDIAENSLAAQAKTVEITVIENLAQDKLGLSVVDDGSGMDADMVRMVTDPFVTTRTTRKVGLGIPLLKAAAEACRGYLMISSELGKGTRVEVEFQRSHIDRMPLGDLASTILTLCVSHPQTHWIFRYQVDQEEFIFDNAPVKDVLGDIPWSEPAILAYLREHLESGIADIQPAPQKTILDFRA